MIFGNVVEVIGYGPTNVVGWVIHEAIEQGDDGQRIGNVLFELASPRKTWTNPFGCKPPDMFVGVETPEEHFMVAGIWVAFEKWAYGKLSRKHRRKVTEKGERHIRIV